MPRIPSRRIEYATALRHRYFFQDPVRFLCLLSTGLLYWMTSLPLEATIFVVATVQLCAISIVWRFSEPGWSYQWGVPVHPSALMSRMCMDVANLSACTLVGALLLVRHFNGTETVLPLALLIVGVCIVPDIRFCRWLLAGHAETQSEHLRSGYFWRDPVKLGAMLSMAIVCLIDRGTLFYILVSIVFLQANTLLVFVDKYLHEIEVRRRRGLSALFLEREGQRLGVALAPLALVAFRHSWGDLGAWIVGGGLTAIIVVPDLLRALLSGMRATWAWMFKPRFKSIEEQPRSIIWLVKPH